MIDTDRLATWMDGVGLAKGEPIEARFISGGTQNEIYEVRRGDVHAALRIPPPEAPAPRDEGIVRRPGGRPVVEQTPERRVDGDGDDRRHTSRDRSAGLVHKDSGQVCG